MLATDITMSLITLSFFNHFHTAATYSHKIVYRHILQVSTTHQSCSIFQQKVVSERMHLKQKKTFIQTILQVRCFHTLP